MLKNFHGLSALRFLFQLDKAWSARLFLNGLAHERREAATAVLPLMANAA
jgi:hypothetical protein